MTKLIEDKSNISSTLANIEMQNDTFSESIKNPPEKDGVPLKVFKLIKYLGTPSHQKTNNGNILQFIRA